jgi:predicted alpha/beta superfamily hydrolase
MNMRKLFSLSAIHILSVNLCLAQVQDFTFSEEGPISVGTTLSFRSEILSEERKILVSLPDDYLSSAKRYPVIYLLDAQYLFQFQYAYGEISALEFLEEIPEVILVGVHSEDRLRDMTSASPTNEGNASHFIVFLRNELHPFIDRQYRTQPY